MGEQPVELPKISVSSLHPPEKDGFLTKCGGSIKTWKRRWFVLKGRNLYYFKAQKDGDMTGVIELEADSFVKEEPGTKKKRYMFSIGTKKRVFFMYADTNDEMRQWIDNIKSALSLPNGESNGHVVGSSPGNPPPNKPNVPTPTPPPTPGDGSTSASPRTRMHAGKAVVPFLQDDESKVLEFWQIWSESIPPAEDLSPGMTIDYRVATSADMQKLQWRVAGPQNIFIQKMVDFFWNVGAPESEIDRLNDVGALINPVKIGSWIDMSAKGGMDGGWYFPVEIPLKLALEAADPGEPTKKVGEWADNNGVANCYTVGRDMGAAPPRQTEMRIKLPGNDFNNQLRIAIDAFFMFGFPAIPEDALKILREHEIDGLCLSIVTSSEGFVRLGLLIPKPPATAYNAMYNISGVYHGLTTFENALNVSAPTWVEYQYLMKGFGYGVYKEGFDVVYHFDVGEDVCLN